MAGQFESVALLESVGPLTEAPGRGGRRAFNQRYARDCREEH